MTLIPPPRSSRGPYASGVSRRAAIIEAAKVGFAESGFDGASLTDIARAAGVTDTGLRHHFRSKDVLLMEVLASAEQDAGMLAQEVLAGTATVEQLWATLIALAEHNSKHPNLVKLSVVVSAGATAASHPAHTWMRERMRHLETATSRILRRGIATGVIRADTDCDIVARETVAVLDGLQLQWILADGAFDMPQGVRDYVRRTSLALRPIPESLEPHP